MTTKQRRPLSRVHKFAAAIRDGMPATGWHFMGSYRRLCDLPAGRGQTVGDLDVLVVRRSGSLQGFTCPVAFTPDLASGKRLARGHVTVGRSRMRADFWVCTPRQVGAFLLYGTGPQGLTIQQRVIAKKKGWRLNQTGLWDGSKQLDNGTEEDIFRLLGMPYLTPGERDQLAYPALATATEVRVSSRSGGADHAVLLDGPRASCDCGDYLYRRVVCQHILEARARTHNERVLS